MSSRSKQRKFEGHHASMKNIKLIKNIRIFILTWKYLAPSGFWQRAGIQLATAPFQLHVPRHSQDWKFYLFLSFWNSAQELRTSRIFYLCLLRAWGNKSMSTGLFANWSRLIFIWTFINNVFWCHSVFDFIFIQWHISRTGIIDNFVALICFRVGMSILEI